MRSKAQGPIATLMLLLPLLALPLLAVFGIPQFAPAVASPVTTGREDDDQRADHSRHYSADDLFASSANPTDPFAETPTAHVDHQLPPRRPLNRDVKTSATPQSPIPRESRSRLSSVMGTQRLAAPAESPAAKAPQPLTWNAAVARLRAMGIRHFRLESGDRPDQFVFVCSFHPAGNPRITRRFEAEASDPLVAVSSALAQVEAWRRQR